VSDTKDFVVRFRQVVVRQGWKPDVSPVQVIERWKQLVELVEEGYPDNIYEYSNDLAIRDLIETLLHDEQLREFEQLAWFRDQVRGLDTRFAAVLAPDPVDSTPGTPWWRARVPAHAGAELAGDIKSTYGRTVNER
jgi:hypothetical protein